MNPLILNLEEFIEENIKILSFLGEIVKEDK